MRRKKRKSGKIIFGILIVVALGVMAVLAYLYFSQPKEVDEPTPSSSVVAQDPAKKSAGQNQDQGRGEVTEQPLEKEPVIQYDGNNPNDSGDLTGVVTYAGATDSSIIIRVNIDQYVDGGTCKLNLLQGGSVAYAVSADLIADVSTSTCSGFNLSRSVVGSGDFAISIELSSEGKTGVISGELSL